MYKRQLTVIVAGVTPTITTQPASVTVTAGQTATFTVVASGTAPLSYQWQKNGTNIPGATGPSYTTPATTLSDNGSTYKVTVTNAAGSATSNAATLPVKTVQTLMREPIAGATCRRTGQWVTVPISKMFTVMRRQY